MDTERIAPGWYADPRSRDDERFWDGDAWTAYTRPGYQMTPFPGRAPAPPRPARTRRRWPVLVLAVVLLAGAGTAVVVGDLVPGTSEAPVAGPTDEPAPTTPAATPSETPTGEPTEEPTGEPTGEPGLADPASWARVKEIRKRLVEAGLPARRPVDETVLRCDAESGVRGCRAWMTTLDVAIIAFDGKGALKDYLALDERAFRGGDGIVLVLPAAATGREERTYRDAALGR